VRIVTWNIAGGCKIGREAFNYHEEDIDYFVDQLAKLNADVICLQESHTNDHRSLAEVIAKALGGYKVADAPLSPSHINPDYQLAIAILGKKSFAGI
jgi:exonuclease III